MKIILENTSQIVQVNDGGDAGVLGRLWEGKTDSGIYVQCVIVRIAAPSSEDQTQFERELKQCIAPKRNDVFPLRMVI